MIGYRWDYVGAGDEINTMEVLDKTKLIEDVTCIVVNDRVFVGGELIEDTDDWYAQRKNGTVDYCGESVRNYETFAGDEPPEPELLDVHGQWKAGRDRDPFRHFLARIAEGGPDLSPGVVTRRRGRRHAGARRRATDSDAIPSSTSTCPQACT